MIFFIKTTKNNILHLKKWLIFQKWSHFFLEKKSISNDYATWQVFSKI